MTTWRGTSYQSTVPYPTIAMAAPMEPNALEAILVKLDQINNRMAAVEDSMRVTNERVEALVRPHAIRGGLRERTPSQN